MTARLESTPTGDTIAQKVQTLKQGDSLADVVKDLTDAHAHRPGKWQQDLDTVNQELHEKGLLPGVDIVGLRGQDIVTKDQNGKYEVYDPTNLANHHALEFGGTLGDRAKFNADGSGELTVAKGDNAWTISRDVLKAQGNSNPTDNQIANYELELKRLNGNAFANLHPGDTLKLPSSARSGEGTEFASEHAATKELKDKLEASQMADAAKSALAKFHGDWHLFANQGDINKDEIAAALKRDDLTADERKALQFMQDNFSRLANVGTPLLGRGDSIWAAGIDQWLEQTNKFAELDRVADFGERKAG